MSPIYYVTFTTAVLSASFVLFQGFNITDSVKTITLLCGFLIIFSGVYLLNFPANNNCATKTVDNERVVGGEGVRGTRFGGDSVRSSEDTQCEDRTRLMHGYGAESDAYPLQTFGPEGRR